MCEEIPSLKYDDGARTIFLYTKGTEGNPPKEISQLLHYMEHTTTENAVNDSLKSIDQMVNAVKHDKEVSLSYMKMIEWEKMLIRQGREEEQTNTERERLRADSAEKRAVFAEERANSADHFQQAIWKTDHSPPESILRYRYRYPRSKAGCLSGRTPLGYRHGKFHCL